MAAADMKKMKIQLSRQFPDEMIEEIFARLPVEPLMKFRCVSKSLNALICSKRFIKLHLENSRKNRSFPYQRVIITPTKITDNGFEARQCSLQSLFKLEHGYRDLVDFPTSNVVRVVGSCNGVVCIMRKERRKERDDFVMWNPATRAVRKLPPLKLPPSDRYSGWDILSADMYWEESRDAYKVFAFLLDRKTNSYAGSLYSSDTDSWSTTLNQGRVKGRVPLTLGNGQFVSGKFHWLVKGIDNWRGSYEIVSFDPESKAFEVIGLPSDATLSDYYRLAVVGGCLCVLDGIGIWIMKEYGVVKSWKKVGATELQRQLQPSWFVRGEDGEVVLLPSFLVCCNGKIQETWVYGRIWRAFQMHLHIQTLVSP